MEAREIKIELTHNLNFNFQFQVPVTEVEFKSFNQEKYKKLMELIRAKIEFALRAELEKDFGGFIDKAGGSDGIGR